MPPPVSHPKRILVTGGRGRLASLIADHFRAPAHHVSLFSRSGGEGFQPLEQLTDVLPEAAALLHLAWSTLPATSEQGGGTEWKNDLPRLDQLLQSIARLPYPRRPHFVFFSSGGTVYGNAPGRANLESDPCQPIGWYGRAKLAAEQLIETQMARHGLACAILRISNPYGYPVPKNRAQGIIPHAIRSAVESQPLSLWGDGSARKDFLYYTDFLSAVETVIERQLSGTFNLCANESHTVREVIGLAEKKTGQSITLRHEPAPVWDVHDSRLDNGRFVAATGWRPQVSLDEGVRRAAAGYAAH
jgi:UDP-glucose 4-epimerase